MKPISFVFIALIALATSISACSQNRAIPKSLADDLMNAVCLHNGEALYANYIGTEYAAMLYRYLDDKETVIGIWEDLKRFLAETEDSYDPEELAEVRATIQKELNSIHQ